MEKPQHFFMYFITPLIAQNPLHAFLLTLLLPAVGEEGQRAANDGKFCVL